MYRDVYYLAAVLFVKCELVHTEMDVFLVWFVVVFFFFLLLLLFFFFSCFFFCN